MASDLKVLSLAVHVNKYLIKLHQCRVVQVQVSEIEEILNVQNSSVFNKWLWRKGCFPDTLTTWFQNFSL